MEGVGGKGRGGEGGSGGPQRPPRVLELLDVVEVAAVELVLEPLHLPLPRVLVEDGEDVQVPEWRQCIPPRQYCLCGD